MIVFRRAHGQGENGRYDGIEGEQGGGLRLTLEFFPDGLEKLHVALSRVLLERRDEGVGHGACRCSFFGSIGALTGQLSSL